MLDYGNPLEVSALLDFRRISNEVDVLVLLGEINQVQVVLDFDCLVLFDHALQTDQGKILVLFLLSFLLAISGLFHNGVVLSILKLS